MDNRYAQEFPINQDSTYLNHAAVSPWPKRAGDAVINFAQENVDIGASKYLDWIKTETQLRQNLAQILNASVDEVALVKNTSEALSFVAYGIDWQEGDVILISDEEFPSNRIVWESLASKGVLVKEVSLQGNTPEEHLLAAIEGAEQHGERIRLVSISAVQYGSGTKLNIEAIGEACAKTNTLFCVDAIQAVGAQPFDVKAFQCDFAMADGHKWLLGPEGLGFFYIKEDRIPELSLSEYGWHMIEHAGDYSTKSWQPASTAVRFECGSPNMLAAQAFTASTELLLEVGLETVAENIAKNIHYLHQGLVDLGANILTPLHSLGKSGIISFEFTGIDSNALYKQLMSQGVICASRGGGVRFSPHFHTTEAVLDRALEELKIAIGRV